MLVWRGEKVIKKVIEATKAGIEDILNESVKEAKRRVPVLTGLLQGSIEKRIEMKNNSVVGSWGSFEVDYALYVEIDQPYLRPAGDMYYRLLTKRIKRKFG